MQTIAWSPQLNQVVRIFKKTSLNKNVNVSIYRKLMDSCNLSQEEEHAVRLILAKKPDSKITNGLWY
ncbi:MAG: hypothetical protein JWM44_2238 [Bacilli bacterium]|nr:hypothetical protein [Bacilli bacterium]